MIDEGVIYAYMYRRISSWNQVGNNSLSAQDADIRQYAKENNIKIVGDYVDSAKSGTTMKHRDEFLKMLEDIKKNPKVKMILVHHFDRSNRNAREQLNVIYELALQGISIRSTDGLDSMNPNDMTDILDEAVAAQKYSIRLKNETMKGLKVNAETMVHNGGIPPYGYTVGADRKLHIDPAKSPAVARIFEMYAAGLSYGSIIEWLNDNGYKTAKGESFCKTSIKSILENEKYCGTYFWNKHEGKDFRGVRNSHKLKSEEEQYRVEGGVPAIVSTELFNKVQDRLRDNHNKIRSHNGKNYYPMNGRVFCGKCGKPLNGKVQYSKTNKNNEPTKQYRFSCDCCKTKTVNEKYLDDMVIYGLRECIFSPANQEKLLLRLNEYGASKNKSIDLQISILQSDKATIEKRRRNLIDVVANGESIPSIITEIGKMDAQIKAIDDKICMFESSKKVFTPDDLNCIRDNFTEYVREVRNEDTIAFLGDTVTRVAVGDTIDVKLNNNIRIDRETKKIFAD